MRQKEYRVQSTNRFSGLVIGYYWCSSCNRKTTAYVICNSSVVVIQRQQWLAIGCCRQWKGLTWDGDTPIIGRWGRHTKRRQWIRQLIDITKKSKHGARRKKQLQLTMFACVAIRTVVTTMLEGTAVSGCGGRGLKRPPWWILFRGRLLLDIIWYQIIIMIQFYNGQRL